VGFVSKKIGGGGLMSVYIQGVSRGGKNLNIREKL